MNFGFQQEPERIEEIGQDIVLAEQLAALDPATEDPNYWFRFRAGVMSDAARSLAQRRLIAELTVADVVASWGRAIVPTAALAAALAGIMLMRAGSVEVVTVDARPMADSEPIPVTVSPSAAATFVALQPETF
jgi:predicted nicotinamide N-methyase